MHLILTKNKLFSVVLLFGLTTILLVLFDIQYFYLRAIFSFIFLTTIPGLLIMLMLRIRKIEFWEYLVYTIGLSIAFLMFAGLAVNWVLPWLHITNKPLSLTPLLISFNTILLIFGVIAYIRNEAPSTSQSKYLLPLDQERNPSEAETSSYSLENLRYRFSTKEDKDLSLEIKFPKPDFLNIVFFIFPIIFPILSILGAITLNNGGPNYLTMIMLGGISVYVFSVVLVRNKLNKNIYPWAILMMSISLLLMVSLRSWNLFGSDILTEYHVFNLTSNINHWDANNLQRHLYNLCLSITILPTIYSNITNLNGLIVFKVLLPLLISLNAVGIYILAKNYIGKLKAFLSAIFFVSLPSYYNTFPTHERQGLSTLFFVLLLCVLFNNKLSQKNKNIMLVIFGMSMIVSHYSTAFIALLFLALIYFVMCIIRILSSKKIHIYKTDLSNEPKISILLILFLWIMFISWYSIPNGGNNSFTHNIITIIKNLKYSFSDEMKADRGSILQELNIFYKTQPQKLLDDKYHFILNEKDKYDNNNYYSNIKNYKIKYIPFNTNMYSSYPNISSMFIYIGEIIKRLGLIFMLFGLFYLVFEAFKKNNSKLTLALSSIVFAIVSIASMIIPHASVAYSIGRIYQQCLVLLSISVVIGIYFLLQRIKNYKFIIIGLFFSLHFLIFTGIIYQIIGGTGIAIQFSNTGADYDTNYLHKQEIIGISWLSNNKNNNKVYIDSNNNKNFYFTNSKSKIYTSGIMIPEFIGKRDYVYLGYTNVKKDMGLAWLNSIFIGYNIPSTFISENKNLIYNNGGSEVFK